MVWSFWKVCSWSTGRCWTVALFSACRCVHRQRSRLDTDRCRNHPCWRTKHGGCTCETQSNTHFHLKGENQRRIRKSVKFSCEADQRRTERKLELLCYARTSCSRDNFCSPHHTDKNKNSLWVSPQLSGWAMSAHQINMVSEFSGAKQFCKNPSLCQLTLMRGTCGDGLWSI